MFHGKVDTYHSKKKHHIKKQVQNPHFPHCSQENPWFSPPLSPLKADAGDAEALGVQREVLAARLQRHVAHGFLRLVEDRGQAQQLLGIFGNW